MKKENWTLTGSYSLSNFIIDTIEFLKFSFFGSKCKTPHVDLYLHHSWHVYLDYVCLMTGEIYI